MSDDELLYGSDKAVKLALTPIGLGVLAKDILFKR
jgi:hypothetical protein